MSRPVKTRRPASGTTSAVETRLAKPVERSDLGPVGAGLVGGDRGHHVLEGLADGERQRGDLAGDLEQAGGDRAARPGQDEVEDHRRGVDQQSAGSVGGQQGEAGAEQAPQARPGKAGADEAPQIVIAGEERHAEHRGEGERAQMGEDEADIAGAEREEAQAKTIRAICSQNRRRRISGPKRAAGAGGGGGDLDEGP
jgi:hypothetical protein